MSLGLLYGSYFGSIRTVTAILTPLISLLLLYTLFRKVSSPRARSWSLGMMLLSSVFLWLFVAVSLVLCYTFADLYEYQLDVGVRTVFGSALLVGIIGGVPFSIFLRHISSRFVLRKVKDLHTPCERGSRAVQFSCQSDRSTLSRTSTFKWHNTNLIRSSN